MIKLIKNPQTVAAVYTHTHLISKNEKISAILALSYNVYKKTTYDVS